MQRDATVVLAVAVAVAWSCSDDDTAVAPSSGGSAGTIASDAATDQAAGSGGTQSDAGSDAADAATSPKRVLLFSRTTGFRHDSIEPAVAALSSLLPARGFEVTATEDAAAFTAALSSTDVAVFLLTSGDVLDPNQQTIFQAFIESGGGFVGVHSAADTEYDWPWYGALVGGYFESHPAVQSGSIRVERESHLATVGLPATWTRTDEWYALQTNPRAGAHVLLSLDESSLPNGGALKGDRPLAWYHGVGSGRSFTTLLGHTKESWNEAAFLDHVAGGIEWAVGREWEKIALVEFDGVAPNGTWDIHHYPPGTFQYDVTPDALVMHDAGILNQHLTRRGVLLDPAQPYVVEGLFRIHGPGGASTGINSFCFNVAVEGGDGELGPIDTWAMNLDVPSSGSGGVMKHMGFVSGGFAEIGQTPVSFGKKDTEYLLRVGVNLKGDVAQPKFVTASIFEAGVQRQSFSVDYATFPHQPSGALVRIGANTHFTDWTLRSLRVYRR